MHATQSRAKHACVNKRVIITKEYEKDNLHFNHSNFAITFDFAQYLELLNFRGEEPGDAFYFSLLALNVFEIANHSPSQDYYCSFPCHKSEGKKGANNVASMVKHFIFNKEIPPDCLPNPTE